MRPRHLEFVQRRARGPVETVGATAKDLDGDGFLDVKFSNQGAETLTLWWRRAGGLPSEHEELAVGRVSGRSPRLRLMQTIIAAPDRETLVQMQIVGTVIDTLRLRGVIGNGMKFPEKPVHLPWKKAAAAKVDPASS